MSERTGRVSGGAGDVLVVIPALNEEASVQRVVDEVHAAGYPALVVDDPGQSNLRSGEVIDLTAAVTIGRAEDNGLVITDKFCSTHHALIFLKSGQRILRDRNSTNGTFHNGRRVTEELGGPVYEDQVPRGGVLASSFAGQLVASGLQDCSAPHPTWSGALARTP